MKPIMSQMAAHSTEARGSFLMMTRKPVQVQDDEKDED